MTQNQEASPAYATSPLFRQANNPTPISLVDELCIVLAERYWEDPSIENRFRVEQHLPKASVGVGELCNAYLSLMRNNVSKTVMHLTAWLNCWLAHHPQPPSGNNVALVLASLNWLTEEEEHESLRKIILAQLSKDANDKWPYSAASLFLTFVGAGNLNDADAVELEVANIAKLESILRLDPHFWPASQELASSFMLKGEFDKAAQFYQRVFQDYCGLEPLVTPLFEWAYCAGKNGDFPTVDSAMQQYLTWDPDDFDAKSVLAVSKFLNGQPDEAVFYWRALIPMSAERKCWLWVTKPEFYQESDGTDRLILDPLFFGGSGLWSCHEETRKGDFVLLWRTHPCSDIGYLMVAEDDAYEPEDFDWDWGCHFRVLFKFENPITIADLRSAPLLSSWPALRSQFRGSNFQIPPKIWENLMTMTVRHNASFEPLWQFLKST